MYTCLASAHKSHNHWQHKNWVTKIPCNSLFLFDKTAFFKRSKLTPAKQTQTTKHGPHTTTVNSVHVAICRYRPDYRNIAALVKNL